MAAYVGWLITNPFFRKEQNGLKACWEKLSPLPEFPLRIQEVERLPAGNAMEQAPEPAQAFYKQLKELLGKWGLIELVDWNLPQPQGPLMGQKEVIDFVRRSDHIGQVFYVPGWYKIAAKDKVLDDLWDSQQCLGDGRFIKGDGWPIRHEGRYAGMFLALHVLRALRQRHELDEGDSLYGELMQAVTNWLNRRLPEKRGGAQRQTADEPGHSSDLKIQALIEEEERELGQPVRARHLLALARTRMGGKQPAALRVGTGKEE